MGSTVEPLTESFPPPRPVARIPRWGPVALGAFVVLVILSNVATAVWARWIDTNPEGLLLLSSRNRYLALVLAAGVPVWAYALIATARIAAAFAVCHLIGRAYHAKALNWFTRYLGVTPEALDGYQRGFEKAQWGIIPFFVGSNIVAVISGVNRTAPVKLAVMLAIGIAARLTLFWWLARRFEAPLVEFLGWLQRYQWWAVGLSILAVVLVNSMNLRRGSQR